jgi:hypothetical protein
MANQSNVFPAFIRAEYQPNNAFPKMVQDATNSAERIKRQFESDFAQMGQIVKDALTKPLTAAGSLDLGVGQYKAAADAAALHARGLREVADAARRVADSDPLSPALRRQAQAASAAALEADNLSRESAKQALNMDRLQGELDQTASSTQRLASAQRDMTAASAGSRQAYVGMGQQIADVAIQAQMGTNAFVILGQQGSQLAYQLAGAGGAAGRVATFFAGPWGAALLGAVSIAGLLATRLGDTAAAADSVKFATNAMSDAQSILGNVMDITTGRINTQNSALIALAKAQILVAQVQAKTRAAEARKGVEGIQDRGFEIDGSLVGFSITRREKDARDVISQQVLSGEMSPKTAVERLDNLRLAGKLTEGQFATAAASVANLGVELENLKVYEDAGKLLDGTGGRSLLKSAKTKGSSRNRGSGADRRDIVKESASSPFADMLATAREQAALDDLLINGREFEAEILQRTLALSKQKGGVTQTEVEAIAEIVTQERLRAIEIDRQRQKQEANLALLDRTQANLRDTVGDLLNGQGFNAIGNLVTRQFDTYVSGLTDQLSESLFGDAFREQRLKLLGLDKVDEAGKKMASSIFQTAKELDTLRDAARGASSAVAGKVANDNGAFPDSGFGQIAVAIAKAQSGITVTGRKPLTTGDLIKALGSGVFGPKLAADIGNAVESAMRGAAYGQGGSGLVSSLGVKTSKTGGQVGGALGEAAFKKLAPEMFKKLGDFAGPLGSIAGGILGGVVGGLFKKTKTGTLVLNSASGDVRTSGKLGSELKGAGNSIQDQLKSIADQLGGSVGNFAVSIGKRGDYFRVSGSGATNVDTKKTKNINNLIYDGKDEAEATRIALLNAIQDGAILGINQGAQRLLQAGKDMSAQLQKALKFQSVFDRLDAIKDPVGSAIRSLNKEFTGLIGIFKEAGASAQEFAQLEELYGLERAKTIKEASDSLTGSLKSLISDLTKGDSGLSLRDRLSNIRADFNPMADTIRRGGKVDYDKFSEVARQLIEVQREISGSQIDYFSTFDEVLVLSRKALGDQENIVSMGSNTASPFSGSAAPSNASVPVVGAITAMNDNLASILLSINANIGNLKLASGGGGGREAMFVAPKDYF